MSQNITGLLQDGVVAKNSLTKDRRYALGRGSFFLVNTLAYRSENPKTGDLEFEFLKASGMKSWLIGP